MILYAVNFVEYIKFTKLFFLPFKNYFVYMN